MACQYITGKIRYVGLIWLRNKRTVQCFLKLHRGEIFSSILFSFCMLHVVFCASFVCRLGLDLAPVVSSNNVDISQTKRSSDTGSYSWWFAGKQIVKKKKKEEETTNTHTHTNIHSNVHTSQKSFPLTIHCIVLAKGGKCKICNKLGRCAASSEECVGDVPMFWLKIEEEGREAEQGRDAESFGTTFNCHVVTASSKTLREQWSGQRTFLK